MKQIEFFGNVEGDGSLTGFSRERLKSKLRVFAGYAVSIIIRKRGKRSLPQNNYYFGVVIQEIREAFLQRGEVMDTDMVHEFLKMHFNKKYVIDEHGEILAEYGGSTADLNKEQFSDYLERIIQWCAEKLHLVIPEPNTQTSLFKSNNAA